MTFEQVMELVKTVAYVLPAVGAFIAALRIERKIEAQHKAMNSRLDELVESRTREARGVGRAEGLEQGRSERDN